MKEKNNNNKENKHKYNRWQIFHNTVWLAVWWVGPQWNVDNATVSNTKCWVVKIMKMFIERRRRLKNGKKSLRVEITSNGITVFSLLQGKHHLYTHLDVWLLFSYLFQQRGIYKIFKESRKKLYLLKCYICEMLVEHQNC